MTGQAAFSSRDAPGGQQQAPQQHQLNALSSGGGSTRPVDQLLYGATASRGGASPGSILPGVSSATPEPRPAAVFGMAPGGSAPAGFLSTGNPGAGSFSRSSHHAQPPSPHGGSFHRPSLHAQAPSPHPPAVSPMATSSAMHPGQLQSPWSSHSATATAAATSRPPSAAPQPTLQTPRASGGLLRHSGDSAATSAGQQPAASSALAAEHGPAAHASATQQGPAGSGADAATSAPLGLAGAKRTLHVRLSGAPPSVAIDHYPSPGRACLPRRLCHFCWWKPSTSS